MKKLLTLAVALTATLSASAQYFAAPHGTNPDMVPLTIHQYKESRKEIILPQVRGLNIYKADLHTHSIFSDGHATPQFRVQEAWQDGLDVIAITEHMEYRGMGQTMIDFLKGYVAEGTKAINTVLMDNPADERGIQTDQNLPIRLAEQAAERYGITVIPGTEISRTPETIGHYNALFITDANKIYTADCYESFRLAKAQGALIVHNHPGWRRPNMNIGPFEQKAYDEGLI
ncbi:MAG: PHP domain-containing protein, partial [Alistipes sp.]|nr:PHP domain-containing protein [Alistipes sp.]